MDVRLDLSSDPQQGGSHNVSPEEEQRFSEWIQKRLGLYQMMEQQVQTNIKQTVQFGNEFTKQLDEETERLMARYRRQRLDQLQLRDALRQEVGELRTALADERRVHEASLVQARSQAESEIAQAWHQSETEIAQQRVAARAERERILREAHAERDRVLAEIRQISSRLADLQRSLGDLSRLTSVFEAVPLAAKANAPFDVAALGDPSPPVEISPLNSEPDVPVDGALHVAMRSSDSNPVIDADADSDGDDLDAPTLLLPLEISDHQHAQPSEEDASYGYLVLFKGVQSFVVASDLLDQVGLMPGVGEVRLVEYEQDELTIAVTYHGDYPLGTLLNDQLSTVAQFVDQYGEQVELVYRVAA
ncbi:MAG: ATP synthase F0 subunit B [Chloroflexales bacterium]